MVDSIVHLVEAYGEPGETGPGFAARVEKKSTISTWGSPSCSSFSLQVGVSANSHSHCRVSYASSERGGACVFLFLHYGQYTYLDTSRATYLKVGRPGAYTKNS